MSLCALYGLPVLFLGSRHMIQSRIFQVKDSRFIFRCHQCQTKRALSVPPDIRSKEIKCHRCGALSRCILNRRLEKRQLQSGKALMVLPGGKEIEIDLHDISARGVGFNLLPNESTKLSVTDEIQFSCDWNPRLFPRHKYIVRNIRGRRVGTELLYSAHSDHLFS